MKHKLLLFTAIIALFCVSAKAQTATVAEGTEFKARTSLGMDWKIVKGLHAEARYEMRTKGNIAGIERHQLNAGIQYSPVNHLDIGAGYYFIGHYDGGGTFKPQHRIYTDVIGSYKFGAWKLSLRERVQMTHCSYDFNRYQKTPNLVELKSRLKIAYKGLAHIEPYAFVELRNCFNGPSFTADYNETKGTYTNYEFLGYKDAYISRIRGAIGLEWGIDRHNSIDARLMADFCSEKQIDTDAGGTKLKSYNIEKSTDIILSVGYIFSF